MSKRQALLIHGAGAIGRGYVPWVYGPDAYDYFYVESNPELRSQLQLQGSFTSYKTVSSGYEARKVPVAACFAPGDAAIGRLKVDGVVTCVGPRNFMDLEEALQPVKVPIICLENDASLPRNMRDRTHNRNLVFGIPDVITSSTASDELLARDPLAVITEEGTCFIDAAASSLPGNCRYVSQTELARQWAAKLYIHNTPHCIAAYLGQLLGVTYLHEVMQVPSAATVVDGAMREMQSMLEKHDRLAPAFLGFYAEKELQRFANTLLFDPISRVAREPFRKLAPNERLIGAAQRCLVCGVQPSHLMLGIMAAFLFERPQDPDFHIKYLVRSLSPQEFLVSIIRLRRDEALCELLTRHWDDNIVKLREIQRGH